MIESILQESKEKKSLIGFNYYGPDNGFYCGFVLQYSADFVVIQHYTRFGEPDGILVHKLSDIKYFEKETEYLKGLNFLIQSGNTIQTQTYKLPVKKELFEEFLNLFESFIGNKNYLVKFELNDGESYFGFLEWCDEDNFLVIQIDVDGLMVGKVVFRFEDLKAYWVDEQECRKRKLLYEYNYTKQ